MRPLFSLLLLVVLAGCGGSSETAAPGPVPMRPAGTTLNVPDARLPFSTVTPPGFSFETSAGDEGELYAFAHRETGAAVEFYIPGTPGFEDPVAHATALAGGAPMTRQRPMGPLDYIFSWTEGDTEVTVYSGVRSGRRYYIRQTASTPADQRALRSILDAWTWLPEGTPLL